MLNNASVLITGGTGSFGQCCVRMILSRYKVRKLIIFSRDEFKQFEMREKFPGNEMRYFLGDVRDVNRLRRAFQGVDYVIHTAAVKQVPALEYNPDEAVKTNIHGSENVISAALDTGVKKVIALSTDKAALPVNLYGATKLVADKLFETANNIRGIDGTRFSVVRYGNVLNSRGSVVPYFRKLLAEGRTRLPVTDLRMTRFFLTLEQAVEFVLKAFTRMHGGEIFVPKIPSLKITDLASVISGKGEFDVVGIRPGEKLHEMLIPKDLSLRTLEFPDFLLMQPVYNLSDIVDYSRSANGEIGKPVSEDFEYRSDNNPWFLSQTQIRDFIGE